MADVVDKITRSRMMSGIRGKNTRPEMLVRKRLHAMGYRYRLHDKRLPGKPDLVFPGRKAVIFVHGCFWHGHGCKLFKWPSSNVDFWRTKILRNRENDQHSEEKLLSEGWRILVVWECALKGPGKRPLTEISSEIAGWLETDYKRMEIKGETEEK
jgi:DNA mismatch endonuclease (patch repair protein)